MQARELQNVWRTRAEEFRIKMERLGTGAVGVSEYQQEVNRLQAALTEAQRLRLIDAEKLAKQARVHLCPLIHRAGPLPSYRRRRRRRLRAC